MNENKSSIKREYDLLLDDLLQEYQDAFLDMEPEIIVLSAVEIFLAEAFVRGLKVLVTEPTEKEIEYLQTYGLDELVMREFQDFPDLDPDILMQTYLGEVDFY